MVTVRFEMYCGDGSGADGLAMNLGANDLAGRVGEVRFNSILIQFQFHFNSI